MLWRKRFAPRGGHPAVASDARRARRGRVLRVGRVRVASISRDGVGTTSTFAKVTGDQPRPWIAPGRARGEWFVAWLDVEAGHTESVRRAPAVPELMRGSALREALWVSADVTLAVAAVAVGLPERWHTTLVGFVFLAATWALVWRQDDEHVRARRARARRPRHSRAAASARRSLRDAAVACAWAFGLAGGHRGPVLLRLARVVAPVDAAAAPSRWRCNPVERRERGARPALRHRAARGGLLPRLPAVAPRRRVGAALARARRDARPRAGSSPPPSSRSGTSPPCTLPTRLAVFFPALLFGWLRARTGGIGASVCFHMLCNVYSQVLGRGYGLY